MNCNKVSLSIHTEHRGDGLLSYWLLGPAGTFTPSARASPAPLPSPIEWRRFKQINVKAMCCTYVAEVSQLYTLEMHLRCLCWLMLAWHHDCMDFHFSEAWPFSRGQNGSVINSVGLGQAARVRNPAVWVLAVGTWGSCVTSLVLRFIICQMGIIFTS